MKAPLILACLLLLAPMLPAASRLLEDGPPGFLHFQQIEKDDPDQIEDTSLRISTISALKIYKNKRDEKAPYTVMILSYGMHGFREHTSPMGFYLDFMKKEDAENMMLKITRLANEAK